jgi:hypothetical protein
MPRFRLIIAACFATIAVGAVASATASAAGEWDVNGTKLAGTAALASPAKVLEHGKLVVVGAGVTVECTSTELGISGGEIAAPDQLRVKSIEFKTCTANGENCKLEEAAIKTEALHGLAELDGTLATFIKVLPLPSKTFAVLHFTGELCAISGAQPVTGTADLLAPSGKDPSVLQTVNAFSLKGSLKVGSSEAELAGLKTDIKLVSGQTWNFL